MERAGTKFSVVDDLIEIDDLLGRYSFGGDDGQPEDYADVFSAAGAFVGRVGRGGGEPLVGRAAILAFARAAHARAGRGTAFQTRHHQASPVVLTYDGDTARTRTYLLVTVAQNGASTEPRLTSTYEDRLERTPSGWRIAERKVGDLGPVPADLVLGSWAGRHEQQEDPMGTLTAIDRLDAIDVVNRCSHVVDGDDPDLLHRVMTDDAVVEVTGEPTLTGRDAVAGRLWPSDGQPSAGVRRHVRNTIVVDAAADRIVARSYFLITTSPPEGKPTLVASGTYEDEIVRAVDGWRITHRTARPDFATSGLCW